MKSDEFVSFMNTVSVAPLAGAWIEIPISLTPPVPKAVAPLAGAWIEIYNKKSMITNYRLSLPLRERGLKFVFDVSGLFGLGSLPLRERGLKFFPAAPLCMSARRSPCGSVD